MKILLTLFFLLFSSSVLAEDISDFQLEGISIGDSALDFFSEKEIIKGIKDYGYKDNSFVEVEIYQDPSFKIYENIQIAIKANDKKYIIYKLVGFNFEDNAFLKCFKKVDKISEEISLIFKNATKDSYERPHRADPTGESKIKAVDFWLESGGLVGVECYDWSEEFTKKNNWLDNYSVYFMSEEYLYWLNNKS